VNIGGRYSYEARQSLRKMNTNERGGISESKSSIAPRKMVMEKHHIRKLEYFFKI
jgi:hypothetical protein